MKLSLEKIMLFGIHLGHSTACWNPKIKAYVFGIRNNMYIIDLIKSRVCLEQARKFVIRSNFLNSPYKILFVGTTVFFAESIKNRADACECYYVNKRWLGGILTNWNTIKSSLVQFQRLEREYKIGYWDTLSKKQVVALSKRLDRFNLFLGGFKGMKFLPIVVIIARQCKEYTTLHECRKLSIPIISTLDTNCDPSIVTVGVPINEDSVFGIKLFLYTIMERYKKVVATAVVEKDSWEIDLGPENNLCVS